MWRQIKELMAVAERSSVGIPVTHDVLERPHATIVGYQQWTLSSMCAATLDWISSNYASFLLSNNTDRSIAFLNSESKKGFVIYLHDNPKFAAHPEYLMDFLKGKMLSMNYKLYTSDVKTFSSGSHVETQQRHYLKPPLEFVPDEKLSQLFGNISINFILRDGKPYLFKFSATTYKDHLFQDAESFEHLMTQLLHR